MNLKPLGERLVLKKSDDKKEEMTKSGIVLPSSAKEAPVYAEVVAVGSEVKSDTVKVGDKVIYSKYAGTDVKLEDTEYIVVKFEDVLAVIE